MTRALLATFLATLLVSGCLPQLTVPAGAQITCDDDDGCPAELICLTDAGRCVDPGGPCVTDEGRAVADGTACGSDLLCVRGSCGAGRCGDGYLDLDGGEACDPALDPRCREDCAYPQCGDGIVDIGETCDDEDDDACIGCVHTCTGTSGDCDLDGEDCECLLEELAPSGVVALSAEVLGRTVYALIADGLENGVAQVSLIRVNLDNPADSAVLDDDLVVAGSLALADGAIYAAVNRPQLAGYVTSVERITNEGRETIYSSPGVLSQMVIDGDRLLATAGDGDIYTAPIDGSGTPEVFASGCTQSGYLDVCGAELVCFDVESATPTGLLTTSGPLRAIRLSDASSREVARGVALRFGCHDDRIVWHDGRTMFIELEPGRASPIGFLPVSAGATTIDRIFVDDDRLFFTLGAATALFLPGEQSVQRLAEGYLLTVTDDEFIIAGVTQGSFLYRMPR